MFEGVLKGELMLSFVALHKGDIEVPPPILEWIYSWAKHRGRKVELMTPEGWFDQGHNILGRGEIMMTCRYQVIVPVPWCGHQLQAELGML